MTVEPTFSEGFQSGLEELFRWRRDVRHFRREPLERATLLRVLGIADTAPSVGLSQPWRFVIVEDAGRRKEVRDEFVSCNRLANAAQTGDRALDYARLKLAGLDDAPCHLAVFVEPEPAQGSGLGRLTMPETVAYSAVMAIHTLWLAARAVGLGLGWVSILDPARITQILEVPADWRLVGYLCLGYPAAEHYVPELERESWEQRRYRQPLYRREALADRDRWR